MKKLFLFFLLTPLLSYSQKTKVDLLVYNATIYTVDAKFSTVQAMAVKDGKIVEVGKAADLKKRYDAKEKVNAQGKYIFPGFIDAHAHFFGYGISLQNADLVETESCDAIIEFLIKYYSTLINGSFIDR